MLRFNRLVSGGIITNYDCSSKCKHCVYASSPSWPKDQMEVGMADEIFRILKGLGCSAVHIGGGEPLLRPHSLFPVLEAAGKHRVDIEYIETNASWYRDADTAAELIRQLKRSGVHTLLISIDPFHNEYIPFHKVKGLIAACQRCGMEVFPWRMEFWGDLEALEDDKTHGLEEYESYFGSGYRMQLLKRYQLNLRGRALQSFKEYMRPVPTEEILRKSAPCDELQGIHHFHIDLYGNFIPQSCPGLSIHFTDLVTGVAPEKYPVVHMLHSVGIRGLCDLAAEKYGFIPGERYCSKCDLCYEIRRYLVSERKLELPDLQPLGHYKYM